jgi:DNA adenine methylase
VSSEKAKPVAVTARPFVKWAGGKRQLLRKLLEHVPVKYGRYFEPFLGGGALFFAIQPRLATLGDVNERLVRTYTGVKNHVERVIALLKTYKHEERFFYELRSADVDRCSDAEVAAWFVYLNKTGFNGLYRVNKKNRFNVPFGRYENPKICDTRTLRACSAALSSTHLQVGDFEVIATRAKRGDFVYFDPPYVPLSSTASFTSYTSSGFGLPEQRRLRDLAQRLKSRGVHVLLSNSDAPSIRELYARGFEISEVAATRMVNSDPNRRGAITELVIT